ncbi:MAG: prepilin-type N-terminal cleavage/methylation domain-containing protein, partial [Proteobacteria bacterium]
SGFSLIELMIVVAIIGILASIAVPNFKKFQVKARQSEAKAQLTSLYTAEKAFAGEWTMYNGDFRNIGYAPEGKMRYQVGFPAIGTIPAQPFQASNQGGIAINTVFNTAVAFANAAALQMTFQQDANIGGYVAAPAGTGAGCNLASTAPTNPATGPAFTAGAYSPKLAIGGDDFDAWTINQDKVICNTHAGI